ncbi:secretin and TonB N-terminal domain-containing protein [Aquabacterium sp. CECT 9606]|uniref:secretin and TonB N-terminal domain-containing protein n=1 Tax=Aquabacterium sp. CECT 9606 TaxID=2845822 RepID=UPI001E587545|nr:secretin and TonB N-terminal domain-containing protein [Aquabacterium sp. CECT 9606]CAH0353109.1 Type 3 secretion system secretin [Aquabacterium sp. CECT 9606]
MSTHSFLRLAQSVLAVLCLTSCAGYQTYREGQTAIAEGRVVDGLDKIKQASELAPGNSDYRRAYLNQRDAIVNSLIRQAELSVANNNFGQAKNTYNQVLLMQVDNTRARAGLNNVEAAQRHAKLLDAAVAMAEAGDLDAAIVKVRQILSESSTHRRAMATLKRLMRQQAEATGKELGIYPQLKATYRTPVSMSFTNASLRQVFEALKLASGLNYLFDKDMAQDSRVTMSFKDKPVEDVLRLVLATNQLAYRILDSDTLLVYPNTAGKSADYREMVVRSFYLSNADVNKTAAMIKGIAKAKDVFVDERLNLIVIRDSAEIVRLSEKLIAAADIVEPEVMLELEVMEVNVNRLQEIGIQWPDAISASITGASGVVGQLTLDELRHGGGLVNVNVGNPLVSAQLRSQKGDSNVLANPRVRVRNRQSAKIMIGDKVPVITVTNTANVGTSESVSYLDVGLKLEIEPTISLDDDVSMKLSLEVSNIVDTITRTSGTQTYRLGTRNTSTVLRVHDGETNVLAGLIQKEDRRSNTGIPYLNELPVLSKLFGRSSDHDSKTELVLLITPRIIRNLDVPGVGLQEFTSGTENAIGAAPIQLGIGKTQTEPKPGTSTVAPSPVAAPTLGPASMAQPPSDNGSPQSIAPTTAIAPAAAPSPAPPAMQPEAEPDIPFAPPPRRRTPNTLPPPAAVSPKP